jgi:hypothetical protein
MPLYLNPNFITIPNAIWLVLMMGVQGCQILVEQVSRINGQTLGFVDV